MISFAVNGTPVASAPVVLESSALLSSTSPNSNTTCKLAAAASFSIVNVSASMQYKDTRIRVNISLANEIPIFTLVNKMDREARDPFELLDDIENELGIKTYPMNWPIGSGKEFKGVYERDNKKNERANLKCELYRIENNETKSMYDWCKKFFHAGSGHSDV